MKIWAFLIFWPGAVAAGHTVCHEVLAVEGWQASAFPSGIVHDVQVTGDWTIADGVYDPVGAPGYHGPAAKRMAESGVDRVNARAAYGTLLYRVPENGGSRQGTWAAFRTTLDSTGPFRVHGKKVEFRINETDPGLSDNAGALSVCAMYSE
jgi:hypothetical protein